MKVSLNWLKEFVDIDQAPGEVAEILTMAGLEVEGIEHRAQNLCDITVARILDIKPHPRADRLCICQLDGGKEEACVVCGATNISKGDCTPGPARDKTSRWHPHQREQDTRRTISGNAPG